MRILENKAKCKICETVVVSAESNQVTFCICGALMVAGGTKKLVRYSSEPVGYIEMTTYGEF